MQFQTCWRCLSRISIRTVPFWPMNRPHIAGFTTSASYSAKGRQPTTTRKKIPFGRSGGQKPPPRGAKNLRLKKKVITSDRSKRPLPGERKKMRKKIVLSNSNALEVEGMPDITAEMMVDADLQGRVVGIPSSLIERLLVVDAFKPTQRWRLFRRPGTLIRKETVQYGKLFEKMSEEGEKQSLRRIFVGERGSGKTVMLLQAMTMAFLKDWVVINFPDAQEIVIGHTEYAPIPETSPTLYAQREYVAKLLSTIARANPILQTINLSSAPDSSSVDAIPIPIPPSISLSRLALLGSQDRESALQIFDLLIQELSLPERPRLLICLDGLGHVMKDSVYKTPAFKPVHAHELAIVDWFMRYLSGASPLPNGGMVLAATSESNIPNVTTLNVALTELEEAQSGAPPRAGSNALVQPYRPPLRNPFTRYDERVLSLFDSRSQSLEVQRIGGMTKEETRGLLEYYARSGILRQRVNEGLVAEKWSVSGGGVVGEMERASILMKL